MSVDGARIPKEKVKVTVSKNGGKLIYNNKEYTLTAGETLEVYAN